MASTSSPQTEETFPYPLGVNIADSVTLRLCATNYFAWKQLMLRFLESHKLSGFVDGTINLRKKPPPLWESSLLLEERWEEEQETREKKRQQDWNQQHMQQEGETQSLVDWVQERERKQKRREGEWEEESLEEQEQERWQEWLRRKEWGRECERRRERMLERKEEERKEREEHRIYRGWKKSDDLVRGWILATVLEELLPQVMNLVTARGVWIKLGKILTPTFQPSHLKLYDFTDQNRGQIQRQHRVLHRAILTADWVTTAKLLDRNPPNSVLEPITWCLETALIVAFRSVKQYHFMEALMGWIDGIQSMFSIVEQGHLLEQKDISGATALHAAVDGGNLFAVNWLVSKNHELINIGDKYGTLPVHVAAGRGNRRMVNILMGFSDRFGNSISDQKLLHSLASSRLYDIALRVLQGNPELASMEPSPLVIMAQKRTSFLSATSLGLLGRLIYYVIPLKLEDIANQPQRSNIDSIGEPVVSSLIFVAGMQKLKGPFWAVVEKLVPPIKSVWNTKVLHIEALSLVKWLCHYVEETDSPNVAEILTEPLRNATCVGIHEIVEEILESFPSAIHLKSEKDQSLFHLAIVYRRENVFNLIYQMKEDRRAFLSVPDASTNNALHLAGNLTPKQHLLLRASAAGAALQMQRSRKVDAAPSQRTHERRRKNPSRSIHRDTQGLGQRRRTVDERHRQFLHFRGGLDHNNSICGRHHRPRGFFNRQLFRQKRSPYKIGRPSIYRVRRIRRARHVLLIRFFVDVLVHPHLSLWGRGFSVFLAQEIDYWAGDSIPFHYIHDGCIWCDIKNCIWGKDDVAALSCGCFIQCTRRLVCVVAISVTLCYDQIHLLSRHIREEE